MVINDKIQIIFPSMVNVCIDKKIKNKYDYYSDI